MTSLSEMLKRGCYSFQDYEWENGVKKDKRIWCQNTDEPRKHYAK